MSYLIDSHCHLHDPEFFSPSQQTDFLKEAQQDNVRQIICIGTSEADSENARSFSESHANVFWTFGIHPEECKDDCKGEWRQKLLVPNSGPTSKNKLVAIGEIGLDYHSEGYNKHAQWSLLEQMLDLAISLNLPCSFHVRDALSDFFSILSNFPTLKPSVLHSFTDSAENLQRALNMNLSIGINGIATFANLPCYHTLSSALLPHLVLETDAPFLTPKPKRGIINSPGKVKYVAAWLSARTGESEAKIAEITTNNVKRIFNLPDPRSETYFT